MGIQGHQNSDCREKKHQHLLDVRPRYEKNHGNLGHQVTFLAPIGSQDGYEHI